MSLSIFFLRQKPSCTSIFSISVGVVSANGPWGKTSHGAVGNISGVGKYAPPSRYLRGVGVGGGSEYLLTHHPTHHVPNPNYRTNKHAISMEPSLRQSALRGYVKEYMSRTIQIFHIKALPLGFLVSFQLILFERARTPPVRDPGVQNLCCLVLKEITPFFSLTCSPCCWNCLGSRTFSTYSSNLTPCPALLPSEQLSF